MGRTKQSLPTLERRNYVFEVRAEGDEQTKGVIVGRPIVYNSETDICGMFKEIIEGGALDGADLSDVRFLVNHDINRIPLARSRENSKVNTMQLSIDDDGLVIRVELDIENNADARALYSAVKRGDITGMSFMFSVKDERWDDVDSDYPTRHIIAIAAVIEVSAVTFPAYDDTDIHARGGALESARDALESARKTKRSKAPEGVNALELAKAKNNIFKNFRR